MAYNNYFALIGNVYGNIQVTKPDVYNGYTQRYVRFTLAVTSRRKKTYHIPCIAYDDVVDKVLHICRRGNLVKVEGEIISNEHFDYSNAVLIATHFFYVTDCVLLKKMKQVKVDELNYQKVIQSYEIDSFKPLEPIEEKTEEKEQEINDEETNPSEYLNIE